jgi:hypothetical protein
MLLLNNFEMISGRKNPNNRVKILFKGRFKMFVVLLCPKNAKTAVRIPFFNGRLKK